MVFYTSPKADKIYSWLNLPPHFCGWSNLAHGGIIATVLDEIMAWGSMAILGKFILSKTITVDFIRPVILGTEIRAEGWLKSVSSEKESVLEGCIYNSENEICARSTCVAATFTTEAVRKMGVADEKMLNELDYMMNSWR
ncbi:MAG: PaaI family thioesterase [Proteobacteria bacterium]|nr:PaaI family thioesterase [Pseudomonadota bacterium]